MNGIETCINKDIRRSLIAPHAAKGKQIIQAYTDNDGSKISLKICNGKKTLEVVDNDPAAVKKFNSGKIGVEMEKGRNTIVSASATFDGKQREIILDPSAKSELYFTAIEGNVAKTSSGGGRGTGIGKGSIMHSKRNLLKKVFILPPDKNYRKYNLTPCNGSPLINSGMDVGVKIDIEGHKRNGKPDIGAYEKQT
jgi:hypothetical protein